jgi:hypothetical protein
MNVQQLSASGLYMPPSGHVMGSQWPFSLSSSHLPHGLQQPGAVTLNSLLAGHWICKHSPSRTS